MSREVSIGTQTPFDSIKHSDAQGNEYWRARELMGALGYTGTGVWKNFLRVITEARNVAQSQGYDGEILFSDVGKKSNGGRPSQDYFLSRLACYLVAMSAEGSKSQVAAAKTYFAVKTQEREQDEQDATNEDKAIRAYMSRGYSLDYAIVRIKSIADRARLTDSWKKRGGARFYALLTEILHSRSFDIGTQEHMALKGFTEDVGGHYEGNLRPALTIRELAIASFTDSMARAEHEENDSYGITQLKRDCEVAGNLGRQTRLLVEAQTGKKVVSARNMLKEPDGGMFGDPSELVLIDAEKEATS